MNDHGLLIQPIDVDTEYISLVTTRPNTKQGKKSLLIETLNSSKENSTITSPATSTINTATTQQSTENTNNKGNNGNDNSDQTTISTASATSNTLSRQQTRSTVRSTVSTMLNSVPPLTVASVGAAAPNQATTITTPLPPSRRNRGNYFIQSFRTISRTSKVLLLLSLAMVAIQVVVTVTILIVAYPKTCDKPLKIFLVLYIIRVIIACPVNVYLYLNPRDNRRNGQNENNARRDNWIDKWIDRVKSFLDLFATLWFIIGNYLLFTTETCQRTAPEIFYLSLTWVILGYIIITIPILLCLAVIFCLPCVIVAMRVLHVGEAVGITGASEDLISKIPSYKYKSYDNCQLVVQPLSNSPSYASAAATDASPSIATDQLDQQNKKPKYKFWPGKKFSNKQSSLSSNNNNNHNSSSNFTPLQYITITNPDDSICSICLSPYENEEELRHLYCQHHFHRDCVDEWLNNS
ncbi:4315_t:CDS:2 [Entrophospora sp. SA101]|nr:4315_t:CDS:2 [Entrophospora sp. SA101]